MKNRSKLFDIVIPIAILIGAMGLDRLFEALRGYAGRTFDFRPTMWGQYALALLFGLMLVAVVQFGLGGNRRGNGIYLGYVGLALFMLVFAVFTLLIPVDVAFRIPYAVREPFLFSPRSFTGLAVMVLFWIGVSGLLRELKK